MTTDTKIKLPRLSKEERRQQRIVRLINRANAAGARLVTLAKRKSAILDKAAAQLGLETPITMPDGKRLKIVKPTGHYAFYRELELKEVAKNPRPPKEPGIAPTAEAGV